MYINSAKYSVLGGVIEGVLTTSITAHFLLQNTTAAPSVRLSILISSVFAAVGQMLLCKKGIEYFVKKKTWNNYASNLLSNSFLNLLFTIGVPTILSTSSASKDAGKAFFLVGSSCTILSFVVVAVVVALFDRFAFSKTQEGMLKNINV